MKRSLLSLVFTLSLSLLDSCTPNNEVNNSDAGNSSSNSLDFGDSNSFVAYEGNITEGEGDDFLVRFPSTYNNYYTYSDMTPDIAMVSGYSLIKIVKPMPTKRRKNLSLP